MVTWRCPFQHAENLNAEAIRWHAQILECVGTTHEMYLNDARYLYTEIKLNFQLLVTVTSNCVKCSWGQLHGDLMFTQCQPFPSHFALILSWPPGHPAQK